MQTPAEFITQLISLCKGKNVAIMTHNHADVDAISSAFAMSKLIPGSTIFTQEDMSDGAQALSEELEIVVSGFPKPLDGIVVVDTSSYTLAPSARGLKILGIVDHHRPDGKDMTGELEYLDNSSPSNAELIAQMYFAIGKEIERDVAYALSVGIIADGARFKSARVETFETLGKLMRIAGAEYQELMIFAEPEPAPEAKVAVLNAMQKMRYIYAAGYLIAVAEASSNESDCASLLSEAADAAFVAKWKEKENHTRISARGRKSLRVPLNEVMGEVGRALAGAGGGHSKAAGAAVKAHTEEALKECIETFIRVAEKY